MNRFLKAVLILVVGCEYFELQEKKAEADSMRDAMFLPQPFPPFEAQASNPVAPKYGWNALSNGRTVGNFVELPVAAAAFFNTVDILEIAGGNADATQVGIMFCPPQNNANGGFQDNVPLSGISVYGATPATVAVTWPFMQGIVEWGIGGGSNRALFDINNGCSFNLMASSYVRLRVQALIAAVPNTAVFRYGAYVGPGIPKPLGATKSMIVGEGLAVNTETAVIAVPPFARRMMLSGIDLTATPGAAFVGSARFYRGRAASPATTGVSSIAEYTFGGNPANSVWCAVPEGAMFFSVVPQSTNTTISATFDLAI